MRTLDLCSLKEIHCCKLWKIKKNIKKAVLKSREPPNFYLKKPKNIIKGCNLRNLWSRMWSYLEFWRFIAEIKTAVNTLYTRNSEKNRENKIIEEILANLLLVWVTRLELAASTTPMGSGWYVNLQISWDICQYRWFFGVFGYFSKNIVCRKKCTRCRKNTILYQNLVPDFSAFQGFCGFCLKELYHIFSNNQVQNPTFLKINNLATYCALF